MVPASAAASRAQRTGTAVRSHRSDTRNQSAAVTALVAAAKRLIRTAYDAASGSSPQTCAISVKSGLPGGCGIPSTFAAAMYSDVSQNAVVGASVAPYTAKTTAPVAAAQRYGGGADAAR